MAMYVTFLLWAYYRFPWKIFNRFYENISHKRVEICNENTKYQ
jgi:hypothetical protein